MERRKAAEFACLTPVASQSMFSSILPINQYYQAFIFPLDVSLRVNSVCVCPSDLSGVYSLPSPQYTPTTPLRSKGGKIIDGWVGCTAQTIISTNEISSFHYI